MASIDMWAGKAGGQPGVTHVVVIGVESRADYLNDPLTLRVMPPFQKQLSRVREIVGVSYVDNIATTGQLGSAEIRK